MNPIDENQKTPWINNQNDVDLTDEWASLIIEDLRETRSKINEIF